MKNSPNLFNIKKKTIYKVVLFHFVFILIFSLQVKSFKTPVKKDLIVNNIIIEKTIEKPKKIIQKQAPLKKPVKKITKAAQKKTPKPSTQKTPIPKDKYDKLLDRLEQQIQNLDNSSPTIVRNKELKVPDSIKSLKIDDQMQTIAKDNPSKLKELLVKELQDNLKLPEYGEVKVEFTIHPNGIISDIVIKDYKSHKNQNYLKNSLSELSFKNINELFNDPQKFIVIFKNE